MYLRNLIGSVLTYFTINSTSHMRVRNMCVWKLTRIYSNYTIKPHIFQKKREQQRHFQSSNNKQHRHRETGTTIVIFKTNSRNTTKEKLFFVYLLFFTYLCKILTPSEQSETNNIASSLKTPWDSSQLFSRHWQYRCAAQPHRLSTKQIFQTLQQSPSKSWKSSLISTIAFCRTPMKILKLKARTPAI